MTMGKLIELGKKPKGIARGPGINMRKWRSAYHIACVLLIRLKQIRILKKLLRMQETRLNHAESIIVQQQALLNTLYARLKRMHEILGVEK